MQMSSLMLMALAMFSGCSSQTETTEVPVTPDPVVVEKPEHMSLAFASVSNSRAMSRLAEEVVQLNGMASYRLIKDFRIIAQKKDGGSVSFSDSWVDNPSQLVNNANFKYYHSTYCSMAAGVNACLVYAKAKDEDKGTVVATKVFNGSLTPGISALPTFIASTNDIQFCLDPIINDATILTTLDENGIPAEAWILANALTAIVNDSHNEANTLVWKSSTNTILRNLLQRFTNNGADLPGSVASVKQWMLDLAQSADYYRKSNLSAIGEDEKAILEIIKTKAEAAAAAVTGNYPRNINLPDGAAALRWIEVEEQVGETTEKKQKFVPQMQTTTLDDINSVSRFVYPPALYYFVDSYIKTSPDLKNYADDYETDHSLTWSSFIESFPETEVKSNTKTVVVTNPLQYAVAHLTMEVKASATSLEYGEGSEKKIDINDLTLRGVIIGGQRPVDYDFKPINNSEFDVSFIYDSQINSSNSALKKPGESESGDIYHTLALQSLDGEDVNIILEFQYADGVGKKEFKCLNGYVYPGTRFYLVGELKLPAGAADETDDYKKRVFTQDYTTTVAMTVNSLEKAYNVLPSLLSNSLEIGVMITPQWFSATPSGPVVME